MSLLAIAKGKGPSGFGYHSTAEELTKDLDLSGRTYLVTGSNSGLGLETVRVLALRGARVIAAARTAEKSQGGLRRIGGRDRPHCVRTIRSRLGAGMRREGES